MGKKLLCCLICLVMISGMFACSPSDPVAATVNGIDILESDVEALVKSVEQRYLAYGLSEEEIYGDEASREALYEGALEALIERQLTINIAEAQGMAPYTEKELSDLQEKGTAELNALRDAAEENEGVELADMLAMLGSTEANYVDNYIAIAKYSRACEYIIGLAQPTKQDYIDYYERMIENQKDTAQEDPNYLGNYAENGTLVYQPEGAIYVEYIRLSEEDDISIGFVELLKAHSEDDVYDTAIVFSGSTEFSEETIALLLDLAVGEETQRVAEGDAEYIFKRMGDYTLPDSWETMPESMRIKVQKNVGEAYLAELIAAAYTEKSVVKY